jgi:hypothetical protein
MSYKFLRCDAGNIRTIAASNSHKNSYSIKGLVCHTFANKKGKIVRIPSPIEKNSSVDLTIDDVTFMQSQD